MEGKCMVNIQSPKLTLTTVDDNVTIRVQYNAQLAELERHWVADGMNLVEKIEVVGIDPPGSETGRTLVIFPLDSLNTQVMAQAGVQNFIERDRSLTVPRAQLQEDPDPGDEDEIRCRITIIPGIPATAVAWTNQGILLG